MKLTKLFKAVGVAAIIGACLLPTACNVSVNNGDQITNNGGNGNNGGSGNTPTTVPQQTLPTGDENKGLEINDAGQVVSKTSGIDFSNYAAGDYSIKVRNNTQKRLVAFLGNARESSLISGIPASATNHGLYRNSDLFAVSSDFILVLVTEEDYIANKDKLSNLDTKPFTRIYAYYNKNVKENNIVYEISSFIGGACSITLNNTTNYNVELRKNGINGETIGYAARGSVNTTFMVDADDYYIFPVFRKFDSVIGEIITVYPKKPNGKAWVANFSCDEETTSITLTASQWVGEVKFSPSASYIEIVNNSTNGVSLYDGAYASPIQTSTGGTQINPGKRKIFAIPMTSIGDSKTEDPEFTTYTEYAQYCVGSAVVDRVCLTNNKPLTTEVGPDFKFYAGKMYTVKITDDDRQDIKVDLTWMDSSTDVAPNLEGSKTIKTSLN